MLRVIAISLFILTVIRLKVVVRLDFFVDVYDRFGGMVLRVFGLKIFYTDITYSKSPQQPVRVWIKNGKKEVKFKKPDGGNKFADGFFAKLFTRVIIKEIGIDAKVGSEDAFAATMLTGGAKMLFYSAISFLKSRQSIKIYERFEPRFNANIFTVRAHGILSIAIADIIFSFIANLSAKNFYKSNKRSAEQ